MATAATLTTKGQITIPKAIRDHLRLKTGDIVEFLVGDDREVTIRAGRYDVGELRGLLRKNGRAPVSLDAMDEAIRRGRAGRRP